MRFRLSQHIASVSQCAEVWKTRVGGGGEGGGEEEEKEAPAGERFDLRALENTAMGGEHEAGGGGGAGKTNGERNQEVWVGGWGGGSEIKLGGFKRLSRIKGGGNKKSGRRGRAGMSGEQKVKRRRKGKKGRDVQRKKC